MRSFPPGSRVLRTETGEVGTVRHQFMDGSVTLTFDDGRPAELDASSLQIYRADERDMTPVEWLRLSIVDRRFSDDHVQQLFLDTEVGSTDDIEEVVDFLSRHRPAVLTAIAIYLHATRAGRSRPHPD